MKSTTLAATLALFSLCTAATAQHSVQMPDPFSRLKPAEKRKLFDQATGFFNAAQPAVATIAKSTVVVSYRQNHIAYGTVVAIPDAPGPAILTKWSEVRGGHSRLVVTSPAGRHYRAQVTGVYPDHDLALLAVSAGETDLVPVNLATPASPGLGAFIALARPDGKVEGFGVVSVLPRSLRESDKAYLGVMMDFSEAGKNGVPLQQVMPDSAAAKAGLRSGDIITAVNQTAITGAMEMRNLLQRLQPGSTITIGYRRQDELKTAEVHLGSRADNADIRRVPRSRMNRMERMGTVPSNVRTDFPSVIQSDMPIEPHDTGAPVADLNGNIVGIAIARGSRIKTYIIPADTIRQTLATPPTSLNKALAMASRSAGRTPPRAAPYGGETPMERARRLLREARRQQAEHAENLRKIEDALREMEEDRSPGRRR